MGAYAFDSAGIEPAKPFEPLPPGDYLVAITKSGFEPTKDGRGSFLKLEMQVLDGASKGRTLFDRLNLNNPSEQAVSIARQQMAAICHAVGKLSIKDTEELHNVPMLAKVAVRPIKDRPGELSNEVKGYQPTSQQGGGQTASAGAATGGGTSGGGGLPWQR